VHSASGVQGEVFQARSRRHEADRAIALVLLGAAPVGFRGRIRAVNARNAEQPSGAGALPAGELERRLLELGFVEGAQVEILHEGPFGRDPIAVRVNDATIALRRREARALLTEAE
jgi:ferrous iron transport protein A